MITQENLGLKLKELRKSRGLTEEEAAKSLGKSGNSFISRIESGETNLNINTLNALCSLYKVTPLEVFGTGQVATSGQKGFLDRVMFRSDNRASEEIQTKIKDLLPTLRKLGSILDKVEKKPFTTKDIDPNFSEEIFKDIDVASKYAISFAQNLRSHLGIGKNAIVDIQDICWKYLNIPICGIEMADDVWGIYSRDRIETPLIIYTLNSKNRQRNVFTIAHELGHHFFFKDGLSIDYKDIQEKNNIYEKVANKFAQELLIPSEFLRTKFDEIGLSLVKEIKPDHVVELCNFFKVSYAMMIYCLLSARKIDDIKYKSLQEYGEINLEENAKNLGYYPETYLSAGTSLKEKLEEITIIAYRSKKITRLDATSILDITSQELLKKV